MSSSKGFLIPCCVAAGLAATVAALIAQEPAKPKFTARELFYAAVSTPQTDTKPQPKAEAKATQPAKKHTRPRPADSGNQPNPPVRTAPPPPNDATLPDGGRFVTVAGGPPLGLRYTILKLMDEHMSAVAPQTVFHAGDRIQFDVQTNGPGYLYIVTQGSSGAWKPIFPSPEVGEGSNQVEGWQNYTMPPGHRVVFDEQSGTEKVFILFSRAPERDLEALIYSLKKGPAKSTAAPADRPPSAEKKEILLTASVDNSTVGRLRTAYARDLVIESVDENTPGEKKEKAVYVVNPSGSMDSRVVADLELVHK